MRLVGGRWGFLRIVAGERIVKLLDIPVTPAQVAFSSERLGGPTLQIMLSSQSHSLFGNGFLSFCSNACEVAHRDVKPANVWSECNRSIACVN